MSEPTTPTIFAEIAQAEKVFARAERDWEDADQELRVWVAQDTDGGRMTLSERGAVLERIYSRNRDDAYRKYVDARSRLNALLAELETWKISYRAPAGYWR